MKKRSRKNPWPAKYKALGKKYDNCLADVHQPGYSPYAVCTASLQGKYGKRNVNAMLLAKRRMTRRNPSSNKWRVWLLDVWGNAKDGYEVNDRRSWGYIHLPDDPSDKVILAELRKVGLLNRGGTTRSISIDGDDEYMLLDAKKDGFPMFQLEKE